MSSISSSVDGLVSGLGTSSIISSLIAVDSAAQTRLKSNVSSTQLKIVAYQSVSSKLLAVQEAAAKLQDAAAWTPAKATSTSESVAVSTSGAAATGSIGFTVTAVAAGKTVTSAAFTFAANATAADKGAAMSSALGGSPLDIVRSDGRFVTITPSSGDLDAVAKAVNDAADLGIKAVAVRVGEGKYRLQITSSRTGATEGDFKVVPHDPNKAASDGRSGALYAANFDKAAFDALASTDVTANVSNYTAKASANASITLSTGDVLTSPGNTFGDVVKGLSFTVSKVSLDETTVSVAPDTAAVSAAMKSLVDAANAALDDVALQSRAGSVGADGKVTGGGLLRGDSTLRSLRTQIINAVTDTLTATGSSKSAASFGVESTREGKLKFTESTFLAAYAADPSGVQTLVSGQSVANEGMATRLKALVDNTIGRAAVPAKGITALEGTIPRIVANQNKNITELTGRIADWDVRLADKKAAYQKYYGALEVSLGKLKNQSTWLAGQLSTLS